MTSDYYLTYAPTEADARSLIEDVRPADLEEWRVVSGGLPLTLTLRTAIKSLDLRMAVRDRETNRCLIILGVNPMEPWGYPGLGMAWLIATNEAARKARRMHHIFKGILGRLHAQYPRLGASVYHKNTEHIRWLKRLGFTGRQDAGTGGDDLCHYFERHKDDPTCALIR